MQLKKGSVLQNEKCFGNKYFASEKKSRQSYCFLTQSWSIPCPAWVSKFQNSPISSPFYSYFWNAFSFSKKPPAIFNFSLSLPILRFPFCLYSRMPDELLTSFLSSHLHKIILSYRNLRLIKTTNSPLCSIPRLSLPHFSDIKLPSSKQFLISLCILHLPFLFYLSKAQPLRSIHAAQSPLLITTLVSSQNFVIKIPPFHWLGHVMSLPLSAAFPLLLDET